MTEQFSIRPAQFDDAEAIAQVQVAAWGTTYVGMVPDALIERMTVPDRTQSWQRILRQLAETGRGAVFVCCRGDRVVGFASVGPQREAELMSAGYDGELTSLYLLGDVQRHGLGRSLVGLCASEALELGYQKLSVWVLSANVNARRFYEALGARLLIERESEDRFDPVDEVAYGWDAPQTLDSGPCD